jgi:hypothetical protein
VLLLGLTRVMVLPLRRSGAFLSFHNILRGLSQYGRCAEFRIYLVVFWIAVLFLVFGLVPVLNF